MEPVLRVLRAAGQPGARYSRYYMISLGADSNVTISLESDQDGYLYLLDGFGKDGRVLYENDDRSESPRDTNPLLELESVMTGPYTVDVTTYAPQTMGDFTLSVAIEEIETEVPPTPEPSPEPTPDPPPEATPPPVDIPESVDVQVSRDRITPAWSAKTCSLSARATIATDRCLVIHKRRDGLTWRSARRILALSAMTATFGAGDPTNTDKRRHRTHSAIPT